MCWCCRVAAPSGRTRQVSTRRCTAGVEPDWLAGISIGAINAAVIAGNPPERRIERLRALWELVSSELTVALPCGTGEEHRWVNEVSSSLVALAGAPGFFDPRAPLDSAWPGSIEPLSIYDTAALHATLTQLIDFDLLNDGTIRLILGAAYKRRT